MLSSKMIGTKKGEYIPLTLLGTIIFSAFTQALTSPFHFEDKKVLLSLTALYDLSNIKEIFFLDKAFSRPLFYLSLALDWKLWGNNPFWFHLTNILLHTTVAIVFFDVLKRLLKGGRLFAALGCAYFALHPTVTESVAYIWGRSNVLSALFWLLSFDFYLVSRKGEKVKFAPYCLSFIFFLSAVLAKESAAILAALLLVIEYLEHAQKKRNRFLLTVPFLAVMVLMIITKIFFTEGIAFSFSDYFTHLFRQSVILAKYIFLALFPINLTIDHFVPDSFSPFAVFPSITLLLLLIFTALYSLKTSKAALGVIWFFVALVPFALIPLKEPMAERNLYFAMMGFGLFFASVFKRAFEIRRKTALSLAILTALLLALGCATRNSLWSSEEKLWRDAVRKSPDNARGYNHLCSLMIEKGDLDEAQRLVECALRRAPHYAEAHYNRGVIAAKRGDWELASHEFASARSYNAEMTEALIAQAEMELKLGREDNAVQMLETVLKREPESVKALSLLAEALIQRGKLDKAESFFKKALSLRPTDCDVLLGMGLVELQRNNTTESRNWLEQAVSLCPSRAEIHEALGRLSVVSGDLDEAAARLLRAIESAPNNAELYGELGIVYMKMKNWEEAKKAFVKQMQLKPGDAEPLLRLASLEEARGNTQDAIRLYNRALMLDKKGRYKATLEQILKKLKERKNISP